MFPYTKKYAESESDIQNNSLLYKIHPKCQNTFDLCDLFGKFGNKCKIKNQVCLLFI